MGIPLLDQHNIVDELIVSYGGDHGSKMAADVLGLAVHHEGGSEKGSSAYGIAKYHVVTQGWSHIGYTWVIERNGALYQTLNLDTAGYHAGYTQAAGDDLSKFPGRDPQYYNDHYWAVCLIGNLELKPPTEAQTETLMNLAAALVRAQGAYFQIAGHGELPGKATACPGKFLRMDWIRQQAALRVVDGPPPSLNERPGVGDDAFARQYPTWRDAYINCKGAADAQGQALIAAGRAIDDGIRWLNEAREAIKRLTGGQ